MNLRDLRIGTRLGLGFAMVGGLMALALAVSIGLGRLQQTQTRDRIALAQAKKSTALTMRNQLLESAVDMRNVVLDSDVVEFQRQADQARALRKAYAETLKRFEGLGQTPAERTLLDQLAAQNQAVDQPFYQAVSLAQAMDGETAIKIMASKVDPAQQKQIALLGDIARLQEAAVARAVADGAAQADRTDLVVGLIGVLALLAGAVFAYRCTMSVVRPLDQAVELAGSVASGHLDVSIQPTGRDEMTQLLRSLDAMAGRLRDVVSRVRGSGESIATGSTEIAAGTLDLSQRTEEAAGNLQQTASSIDRLSHSMRGTADIAAQARHLVTGAAQVAHKGGEVVGRVVSSMQEIASSSSKISEIIGVIDGIAFQTNILALNAAVEAARAGEQGRGFAVVASEVRSLAQRSASAAREIKSLILSSVETVDTGRSYVSEANDSMAEIVGNVERVNTLICEISDSAQAQSAELADVSHAVSQLDAVTQQNAALVEQSAAAVDSLKGQAQVLNDLVATFRVA